ncbi:MAG: hypothetical protein AAF823_13180 [Planctomycetota bacterium]
MNSVGLYLWRLTLGNPMAVRVVHNGSRRMRDLWVRMGYLGAMIVLVLIGLLLAGGIGGSVSLGELAKNGTQVFTYVARGQVILVCLLAPLFMASAIAAEQQGKTFDILLTTPLSNLQIVLGSLGGRLFFILALLLSGLPLFSVLLIFGGVPVSSVFLAFATAAFTALFVGSIAVAMSVLRIGGRKAIFGFVIGVIAFLVAAYALDRVVVRHLFMPGYTTWLTPLHPMLVLESAIQRANYQPVPESVVTAYPWPIRLYLTRPFTAFGLLSVGGSFALMLASALIVRGVGQGESRVMKFLRTVFRLPDPGERTRPPRPVTGSNPIAWRESHTRGNAATAVLTRWGFALGTVLLGVGFTLAYHVNALPALGSTAADTYRAGLTTLLLIEVTVILLVAMYMSAGCVSREREDGTLDIFLTTPMTPRLYIWGKLRGLVQFLSLLIAVPVVTLAVAALYALLGRFLNWPGAMVSETFVGSAGTSSTRDVPLIFPEAPLLLLVMLVPFVALVVAVGMNFSLKSKGVLGAVIASVAVIGSIALVLGLCGFAMGTNVPYLGPVVNAFSPATNILLLVDPWQADYFGKYVGPSRVSMGVGAVFAAVVYALIVYALIAGMGKGFDHTVRKLAGTG